MTLDERYCVNVECKKRYKPKAHNSIFCSAECRQKVMNMKILANYHAKKKRLKNDQPRTCGSDECSTILSRYNKESICEACKEKRLDKRLQRWGWSTNDIDKWREK